jgi:hypothetical protein
MPSVSTREEADVRQHLMAIDAQKTLAEAFESHMTEARLLLTQLHTRLAEIEQTQDVTVMRQVVEVLVRNLRIDTHEGATPRRKQATVTIPYAFSPHSVAVSSTDCDTETPRRRAQSTWQFSHCPAMPMAADNDSVSAYVSPMLLADL